MKAEYKNWVPNGMITALTAGTAILGTGTPLCFVQACFSNAVSRQKDKQQIQELVGLSII